MTENIIIGGLLVAVGAVLVGIGLPDKAGKSPKFLQFNAALVLYPGLIMAFLGLGAAELLMGLAG